MAKYITKESSSNVDGCAAHREPVAEEVLTYIDLITANSQQVADRVEERLSSITLSAVEPTPPSDEVKSREYPPLFMGMRDMLQKIETSLNRIEYTLDRVEL